jgi:hypothetical protein
MEAIMNSYPNIPGFRAGAPDTSPLAALSMIDEARNRGALALAIVAERGAGGATADEVAAALLWDKYSSRPRLAELHKRGAIVDSGGRREGSSGRGQAVWVIPAFSPNQGEPVQLDWLAGANTGVGQ